MVSGQSNVTMSLMGLFYCNLASAVYLGYIRFWKNKAYSKVELVNEAFVATISLQMAWFTDYIPTPERQYEFGWYVIFTTVLFILFNMYFILKSQVQIIYLLAVKYCRLFKRRLDKLFPGEIQSTDA